MIAVHGVINKYSENRSFSQGKSVLVWKTCGKWGAETVRKYELQLQVDFRKISSLGTIWLGGTWSQA
jgi:hypothetical protein